MVFFFLSSYVLVEVAAPEVIQDGTHELTVARNDGVAQGSLGYGNGPSC